MSRMSVKDDRVQANDDRDGRMNFLAMHGAGTEKYRLRNTWSGYKKVAGVI